MIPYVIKILIYLSLEVKTRMDWVYLIISFSIEFCWYRAFFSINFKNLISDFINLTSILTRSFRNSSECPSTIGKQWVIKYKNDQVMNFWLSYCNFLTWWISSILLNWAIVFVCWECGLAWYDSAFGTQRSRVRISPLPYFISKELVIFRTKY